MRHVHPPVLAPQWRLLAVTFLGLALFGVGCAREGAAPLTGPAASTPSTYILGADLSRALPPPGEEALAANALDRAAASAGGARAHSPAGAPVNPCVRWNDLTRVLAANAKLAPPLFARAYALVSVACADGITAAGRAERAPTPAGCVVGGAASEVLLDLFPEGRAAIEAALADEAALAGDAGPGPVLRGLALGRVAGRVAVRRGARDGSDAVFTGTVPAGDGLWTGTNPVLPMCGTWRTWIATSGAEFQPEPPYAFGSPADLADVATVVNAAAARTPEQVAIVHKWADRSPPAIWNAMLNERIVERGLAPAEAARAQAYLNMAVADAFISCWATKYAFWIARPVQRIPGLTTVVPTPNFPSYTSGHSSISAAAAEVMAATFPDEAAFFRAEAEEAALSRLWGGIHFPHDNDQGLIVGARLGAKVVAAMRADAAARGAWLASR